MMTKQQIRTDPNGSFEYRSINRVPTALGIERKLCIFGGMLTLILFHLGGGLLQSALFFLLYWGLAFGLDYWEPRLFKMGLPRLFKVLRKRVRQKRAYSARKF
jgi:type IV secretory pathway TrbD component